MVLECNKFTHILRLPHDKMLAFIGNVAGYSDDLLAMLVGIESDY